MQGFGLVSVSRRTNVSSRQKIQRLGVDREADVSVSDLRLVPKKLFAQILQATLVNWAESAVAIYRSVNTNIGNRSMYYCNDKLQL